MLLEGVFNFDHIIWSHLQFIGGEIKKCKLDYEKRCYQCCYCFLRLKEAIEAKFKVDAGFLIVIINLIESKKKVKKVIDFVIIMNEWNYRIIKD